MESNESRPCSERELSAVTPTLSWKGTVFVGCPEVVLHGLDHIGFDVFGLF